MPTSTPVQVRRGPPVDVPARRPRRSRRSSALVVLLGLGLLALVVPTGAQRALPTSNPLSTRPVFDRLVPEEPAPSVRLDAALLLPTTLTAVDGAWTAAPVLATPLLASCDRIGEQVPVAVQQRSVALRRTAGKLPGTARQHVVQYTGPEAARAASTDVLGDQQWCKLTREGWPSESAQQVRVIGVTASDGITSVLLREPLGPSRFRAVVVQQAGALLSITSMEPYDSPERARDAARELAVALSPQLQRAAGL